MYFVSWSTFCLPTSTVSSLPGLEQVSTTLVVPSHNINIPHVTNKLLASFVMNNLTCPLIFPTFLFHEHSSSFSPFILSTFHFLSLLLSFFPSPPPSLPPPPPSLPFQSPLLPSLPFLSPLPSIPSFPTLPSLLSLRCSLRC